MATTFDKNTDSHIDCDIERLTFLDLKQIPNPFLAEYAKHYHVRGTKPTSIAQGIILRAGETVDYNSLPSVPVLPGHRAKRIQGVLHFRRCTPAELADPETHGTFPAERLPDPIDEYSDDEPPEPRARPARVMMEFVFPPKGRRKRQPTEAELLTETREGFQPIRDTLPKDYLGAMEEDLKDESARALKAYAEAEKLLKDALYTHECLRLELEAERRAWKDLWAYVARVAGKDIVEGLVARAKMRVRGKVPEDEVTISLLDGEFSDPEINERDRWIRRDGPKPGPAPVQANARPVQPQVTPPQDPVATVHQGPLLPAPVLAPPPGTTFGGDATSFDDGPFLKRRRDSDVDSDSDADDSGSGSLSGARKRSKASPTGSAGRSLVAGTSSLRTTPPARRSASSRQKRRSPGRQSLQLDDLPPLPSSTASERAFLALSP